MVTTSILPAFPALLAQGMPIHGIVLAAFCAFLGFQLYLFLSHRRAVASQSSTLSAMRRQGGEPKRDLAQRKSGADWLGWVAARFHDGAFDEGQFNREDVLKELDNWQEGHPSYLLLQRMGVMAPLVGLLITVLGFFCLQAPTSPDGDMTQILDTLTPLILGVGTGAFLALINQFLLHLAGRKTEELRATACGWFDDCVWMHVQARPRTAANDAAEAVREMTETVCHSVEQYRGATAAIGQTSESLKNAGAVLVNTLEHFRADTAAVSGEMKTLRSTSNAVIQSLGDIVPNVERTTAELAESVSAFKSVVQEQLGHAADRHLKSAEMLAGSVDGLRESAAQLSSQFSSLAQAANSNSTASREWASSLRDDVLPAQRAFRHAGEQIADSAVNLAPTQRAFREAADSMQNSANALAEFVREGVAPATRRLTELDHVLSRIQEASEVVQQMTEFRQEFVGLASSLERAAAAADAIQRLPHEVRGVLQTAVRNNNVRPKPRRPLLSRLLGRFSSQVDSNPNGRR